jgi:hypothetical protein
VTFNLWTGAEETPAKLSVMVDDVETPARAALMPTGARTLATLLLYFFVIAHRLGSLDWAEYSLRGATESVLRRVDALDISVSRSLDGVWFCLHDNSLLRTSGVDVDPATLTWAEIQTYLNNAPAGGDSQFGPQPYMRLDDFLRLYGKSHVIFLDPKHHAGPQWHDEFYALVEATIPNPQENIVIKFSGDGVTVADAATARGYFSFGYFYDQQYQTDPAKVLADATRWTVTGMEWDAPPATWTAMIGVGKPVVAFLVASLAQRDTAIARGAAGIMCTGVRAVQGAPEI